MRWRYCPPLSAVAATSRTSSSSSSLRLCCRHRNFNPSGHSPIITSPARMKTRKSHSMYKMDLFRKRIPNHTELAYREAVAKLKYLLAESYAPRTPLSKSIMIARKSAKENMAQGELDCADEADAQSVMSDLSKKEPSTRAKYYTSRLSNFPLVAGNERVAMPPAELMSFIERQEEYIEQLERESQYCKDELKNLIERVREVVAENESLQEKSKSGLVLEVAGRIGEEDHQRRRPLDCSPPSIVFESRISELEAQLSQARLELRQARESNSGLSHLQQQGQQPALELELERVGRERRELEARSAELARELARREAEAELRARRAAALEAERAEAEAEARRLRVELANRQDKLRDALAEANRRIAEEKQLVESRFSQQLEQLGQDAKEHWQAANRSRLDADKQRRQIDELTRQLQHKTELLDQLASDNAANVSKMQEELNKAIADRDTAQAEIASAKLAAEKNEKQARQEQSRLQAELDSYKQRLERADADLVQARRENLRLTGEIASLEKEINMNKIIEETRVSSGVPAKTEKGKEEKDNDKQLTSLIFDMEARQAKTVASLEDSLNKQASLVSRLMTESQSLTQRLDTNDQKHKEEMVKLQSNIKYLSNRIGKTLDQNAEVDGVNVEQSSSDLISDDLKENYIDTTHDIYNSGLDMKHQEMKGQLDDEVKDDVINEAVIDPSTESLVETNPNQIYPDQQRNYGDDYINQNYNQYEQYDPAQYPEYYGDQQYVAQEYPQDQQYPLNDPYAQDDNQYLGKETYNQESYNEQDYKEYLNKPDDK